MRRSVVILAAHAGLLDGCRATTHWGFAALLAGRYPQVHVGPKPIFIRSSETVWTAAGVTSGIALALAPGAYAERTRQLEQSDDTVLAIAARCGFGTAETMRRNIIRRVGVSPDQYRRMFTQEKS